MTVSVLLDVSPGAGHPIRGGICLASFSLGMQPFLRLPTDQPQLWCLATLVIVFSSEVGSWLLFGLLRQPDQSVGKWHGTHVDGEEWMLKSGGTLYVRVVYWLFLIIGVRRQRELDSVTDPQMSIFRRRTIRVICQVGTEPIATRSQMTASDDLLYCESCS